MLRFVPIAALAGIVLAVLAIVRARREGSIERVGAKLKLLVPIAVAIGSIAITIGLIWLTLELGAAVR